MALINALIELGEVARLLAAIPQLNGDTWDWDRPTASRHTIRLRWNDSGERRWP